MALNIIYLIVGLGVLIAGAEFLVRGSASIARRFGISPLVIGLTVVSFGTSAPELIVNLFSAFRGSADIAIGNVIGSNIANILLILGVTAVIFPLTVTKNTVWKEIPLALLAVILVVVMGNDIIMDGARQNLLGRTDGFLLISVFIIFMYYTFGMARQSNKQPDDGGEKIQLYSVSISLIMALAGIAALFFGGKLLIDNAIIIAKSAGLSEALIGLTIIAIGTSLPELATSVIAAIHKHNDIAVGNVVGSNIFNIFWILGLTSTILPLPFNQAVNFDVAVSIAATALLFFIMFVGRRHVIQRWQGAMFICLYAAYLAYLVMRG